MEQLTLEQVASFCGAEIKPEYRDIYVNGISKDNRTVSSGDIFIAIRGEKFDGHAFVNKAADAGAVAALVSEPVCDASIPTLVVEDTVLALQKIAKNYRAMFEDIKVVGITGSVGKTTTKEMCASVLSQGLYTLKTLGNLNNDIGLPFTVMGLNYSHQAAVVEMGANHFGEISRLTRVANPDIAVITAIGEAHMEFFKSKVGVRKAKLEIIEGLKLSGYLVLNGDDPMLWELKGKLDVNVIYCGIHNEECDIFAEVIERDSENIRFRVRSIPDTEFHICCGGVHNLQNALLAVAVGQLTGRSAEQIRAGLENFVNTGERQKITKLSNGVTVISDCYNAGPDSMRAALNVLGESACSGRRIAALGDMLELGEHSHKAHYEVGSRATSRADLIFAAGNWAESVKLGAQESGFDTRNIHAYKTVPELAAELKDELRDGDVLLIKGSRGMRMEQILEFLSEE